MHPRLIEAATSPTSRTEGDRIVAEEVPGALSAQSGYTGAFTVPAKPGGSELTIVLWQTEGQARCAPARHSAAFEMAGRRLVAASINQRQ